MNGIRVEQVRPDQIRRIHAALSAAGIKDKEIKESLVYQFTGERETSTKAMYEREAEALIHHLNQTKDDPSDRMRKKIIGMARTMRWTLPGGKVDIPRINNWCLTYGQFKKPLNDHSYQQLTKLVGQFEAVKNSYIISANKS